MFGWFKLHWFPALTALLLLGVVLLVARVFFRMSERRRDVLLIVVTVIIATVLAVLAFVPTEWRWLCLLAGLPTFIVAYHALHLALTKNRSFLDGAKLNELFTEEPRMRERLIGLIRASRDREDRQYSATSLILRFGAPSVIVALTILTVGWVLKQDGQSLALTREIAVPAQYAALGAYLYVLLFLGNRMFRSDITSGAVIWSSVTLVAAPILGAVIGALGLHGTSAGPHLVHFAAGFSLRFMTTSIEVLVRRTFGAQSTTTRTTALSALRGITTDDEERLAEEGIRDVALLAMANPHRLLQSTPYDRRQLLAWMDEALLVTLLPSAWQALETAGITGIIDLAWLAGGPNENDPAEVPPLVAALASRTRLDANDLWQSTLRAHEDPQVQLVWALYLEETHITDGEADLVPEYFQVPPNAAARKLDDESATRAAADDLEVVRRKLYAENRGLFLVHTWRPSTKEGQHADIVLQVVQHGKEPPLELEQVEYQLGPKFSPKPIVKTSPINGFSLTISAHGPMLCVARATVRGRESIILSRYVDFEAKT